MKDSKLLGMIAGLALALLVGAAGEAFGQGPPPSVAVTVTAQTSTPLSVTPLTPGNSGNPNQWFYQYTIAANGSVVDTLPIQICVATNSGTWSSLTLKFGPVGQGGNLSDTQVFTPAIPQFNANGCQTVNITINTGSLAAGNYNKLVEVQKDTANPSNTQVQITGRGIHIHIRANGSVISCFVTDSDFNYLLKCDGTPVTSGDDGRFAIVANRRNIEVATNPGQFYYNVLWTNTTGSTQTVSVHFDRTGVNPQGAQAIHAMIFSSFPALSSDNFDDVNSAIPSGKDDNLESVSVPNGSTLWVDYHLEWNGLGSLVPSGCATNCGDANQPFSVRATVSGSQITTVDCIAGAKGYKK